MKERGVLAWFAGHRVASNLLMLFVMGAGVLSLLSITIEVFPDIATDTVTVVVPYRGASPAEVEEGVCVRVEESIAGVEGIKRLRSIAREGVGQIVAELYEDADAEKALDDIKAAVDRIDTFPAETDKPVVAEALSRRQVISVVLYGDVAETTLKSLVEQVRDDLTAQSGISQVDLAGVRNYEISIEVPEESLRRHGLTLDRIADTVRRASLDLPAGAIETVGGDVLVRTKGQRYHGHEFADIEVLSRADGSRVRLGDVATIDDGFEDTDSAARFDDRSAALARVYRVGAEDALDIAAKVKAYVAGRRDTLPAGVSIATWEDSSEVLRSRISLLLRNGAFGLILVFCSLALFLDLRLAFWTTMGIPISFLGALWLIPHGGITVNMISLFAFIVSLGIVVDDAIVVGENVYAYMEKGDRPLPAAIRGVREMAIPVTFAVLTTVAAFLPLAITAGRIGKIMRNIPIVVVAVLMISLLESLLILPSHLAGEHRLPRLLRPFLEPPADAIAALRKRCQNGLTWFVQGPYARLLARAIAWRYLTLSIGIAVLLLAVAWVAGGFLKFTFMPRVDADNMVAALTMMEGTPLAQTEAAVRRIEEAADRVRAEMDAAAPGSPSVVKHIASTIGQQPFSNRRGGPGGSAGGSSGANIGEVNVELLSSEVRTASSATLAKRWRELAGDLAGAKELTFTSNLFSSGDDVNVELSHRDPASLTRAVGLLEQRLREFAGTAEVRDTFVEGKRELRVGLSPEGRAAGLTLDGLSRQVRGAFYGTEAQRIQRGRDDVRVMVRYPERERTSLEAIELMRVQLPDGREMPFRSVATFDEGRGYAIINRTDRRRVVSVVCDVDEAVANASEINADLARRVLPALAADVPGLGFSFEGTERQQRESMQSLVRNFILAQVAIFALLAIPFRSYTQPAIVMSAIPFGIVGAILGHIIMGLDLSLLSMFGIVALTGVVVNDSLIMIDLINRERAEGIPLARVIVDSGTRRFRPIMLTTLTTFLGLTPMILERSLQARFLIPMAVSLGFGVAFATTITLLLVPSLYMVLEDLHGLVARTPDDAASALEAPTAQQG